MIEAKPVISNSVTGQGRLCWLDVPTSAAASTIHAAASMMPAAAVAVIPAMVPEMPRSRMMAARTGSAVIDVATPMNNMKEWLTLDWPRLAKADLKTRADPAPRIMGTISAAAATSTTGRYLSRNDFRLSS